MVTKRKRSPQIEALLQEHAARIEYARMQSETGRVTGNLEDIEARAHLVLAPHHGTLFDGSLEANIEAVREMTEDDLAFLSPDDLAILRRSPPEPLFHRAEMFLDLIHDEPGAAEAAVGNLRELYARRLAVNPGHAKRWLIAQTAWIVFGRAMDVLRRFNRARAGK
jgi:hypothetical protein